MPVGKGTWRSKVVTKFTEVTRVMGINYGGY